MSPPRQRSACCASDYHLATLAIAKLARAEPICREQRCSDDAPVMIDHDVTL